MLHSNGIQIEVRIEESIFTLSHACLIAQIMQQNWANYSTLPTTTTESYCTQLNGCCGNHSKGTLSCLVKQMQWPLNIHDLDSN